MDLFYIWEKIMRNYLDPHNMDTSRGPGLPFDKPFDWSDENAMRAVCEEIMQEEVDDA